MAHAEQCVRVHGDVGPGERAEPDVGDHRRSVPVVAREKVRLRVQHRVPVQPLRHAARHPSHPSSSVPASRETPCRVERGAARAAATILDVAARAGVHAATISRTSTCRRRWLRTPVAGSEEAVHVLGFVPSRAARGLITGKSRNLAVIVPESPICTSRWASGPWSARRASVTPGAPGRHGEARAAPSVSTTKLQMPSSRSVSRVVRSCGRSIVSPFRPGQGLPAALRRCRPRRRASDRPCRWSRLPPGSRGRTVGPPWPQRSWPAGRPAADDGRRRARGRQRRGTVRSHTTMCPARAARTAGSSTTPPGAARTDGVSSASVRNTAPDSRPR